MYQAQRDSRSTFVPVRNLSYHVRLWGESATESKPEPTPPPLVLLHGWMDVAASYQFAVDALSDAFMVGRRIMAPDWRGFGLTRTATDNFWFPDYLADLDFLLDQLAPGQPVDLVGHSMGGNVAMAYAGVRPQRVRRLINLEGFGMPPTQPTQAPARFAKWIDQLKALHQGELGLRPYADARGVAERLMKTNRRLQLDKAAWLAQHWAQADAQGQWTVLAENAHKLTSANLYRLDEALEMFKCIDAPTLVVRADGDSMKQWLNGKYTLAEFEERMRCVPDCRHALVTDAGHMLHHDQPAQLAALIEDFLA